MNNASYICQNGLGDKLLDIIGFYVICKYLNYNPIITLNSDCLKQNFKWGSNIYDERLFNFTSLTITNENTKCLYHIYSPNPSVSMCPYKAFEFLKNKLPDITFEYVSKKFEEYAKEIIKPSDIIVSHYPVGIENAYGIHLRKSDKINNVTECGHENTTHEFNTITDQLLNDITFIIIEEDNPTFLIVSEDISWKQEIENRVLLIGKTNAKEVKLLQMRKDVNINYTPENQLNGFESVLDMFCLSKCKNRLQGVKYSTFSMVASLLGNGKIINYANILAKFDWYLIDAWSSVLMINGNNPNYDIGLHSKICARNIETNIPGIYVLYNHNKKWHKKQTNHTPVKPTKPTNIPLMFSKSIH